MAGSIKGLWALHYSRFSKHTMVDMTAKAAEDYDPENNSELVLQYI